MGLVLYPYPLPTSPCQTLPYGSETQPRHLNREVKKRLPMVQNSGAVGPAGPSGAALVSTLAFLGMGRVLLGDWVGLVLVERFPLSRRFTSSSSVPEKKPAP